MRPVARASRAAAAIAAIASVPACALFFDFDYATEPVSDASTTADVGSTPIDFVIEAPSQLRIEPGTAAELPVRVERRSGEPRRVIVGVEEPPPASIAPTLAVAVEPGETTASLVIRVNADATPEPRTLRVVATSEGSTRHADVTIVPRGAPCALDRSFGVERDGKLVFETVDVLDAVASPDFVVVALLTEASRRLVRYGPDFEWELLVEAEALALADDALYVASVGDAPILRVLLDGGVDETFGDGGLVAPPCPSPAIAAAGDSGLALLCVEDEKLRLVRYDVRGAIAGGDVTDVVYRAKIPALVSGDDGRLVACGGASPDDRDEVHGVFARWTVAGTRDETFGAQGRLLLPPPSFVGDCAADERGVVGLGTAGDRLAIFALRPDGGADEAFGDAGVRPLEIDGGFGGGEKLGLWSGTTVAIAGEPGAPHLFEHRRDGALVASCPLAPLGMEGVHRLRVLPSGKVVVLGHGQKRYVVARLWL